MQPPPDYYSQRGAERFFVIQIKEGDQIPQPRTKLNLSAMKLFHRFRKILIGLLFLVPSRCSTADSRHKNHPADRFEPPKTSSCSSYYSSYTHYNEAIVDCIEFFNKSA